MSNGYATLKQKLINLAYIQSALAVLHWDSEVFMPAKGADTRSATIAHLSEVAHNQFVALDDDGSLSRLHTVLETPNNSELSDDEAVVVRETWRQFEREKKIPSDLVRNLSLATSASHQAWVEAREKDDFTIFAPHLKKIVDLTRQEAECLAYSDSPYSALLDIYEPDLTATETSAILDELKNFLVPFLQKIQHSKVNIDDAVIKGHFDLAKQKDFNAKIAARMGFDLEAGRIDSSAHPFATGFSPQDVRITSRYKEDDLMYSLGSTMHEVGHALYDQGLPFEHWGTPLGEYLSLGIHESQSRLWENQIGKGKSFWQYAYPLLQQEFPKPFATLSQSDFYRAINKVEPSLIRTESDEVTYNLHIIIRFEIEKALIEGTIEVDDLPTIWNAKYKEYLGIDVPNNAQGVLQDIHWSHGSFGYFPTYTLGNLYSAQFFAAAKTQLLNLDAEVKKGEFAHLLKWLRDAIHQHGRRYTASQLVQRVTGKPLSSEDFVEYLQTKFGEIYNL